MMTKRLRSTGLLVTVLMFFVSLVEAELKVGDTFPLIAAKDQHEVDYAIDEGTKRVLISFDMKTGKKTNKFLAEKGADFLPEQSAVFIANIYGMPGIGRMFALPKMRKYPHRILLGDEEGLLDEIPTEKKRVTVVVLGEGAVIESIEFWDPKSDDSPFGE